MKTTTTQAGMTRQIPETGFERQLLELVIQAKASFLGAEPRPVWHRGVTDAAPTHTWRIQLNRWDAAGVLHGSVVIEPVGFDIVTWLGDSQGFPILFQVVANHIGEPDVYWVMPENPYSLGEQANWGAYPPVLSTPQKE